MVGWYFGKTPSCAALAKLFVMISISEAGSPWLRESSVDKGGTGRVDVPVASGVRQLSSS